MIRDIINFKKAKTGRFSSWDKSGRNSDWWPFKPGESRVIADINGPGMITHIWMTTGNHYREVLIKITFDNAEEPSILCPYGDFFGLGHSIVNSYQSLFFSASTKNNNAFNSGCALNCYLPMPFKKRAIVELINESEELHRQYFYIDYETYEDESLLGDNWGYLHAEYHRQNPFGGWGHEILVNKPEADIINKEKLAWENNYVILETKGRGHYIGCNYSITNIQGTWWGEGDDMIWVDGYKWPPDLHGTGSEDYLNQAWGMQDNAFLRNGSSIFENNTGGYQTSYVFHVENPVRFESEIKVTIEFGHGNHLRNEVSSVAYWYADKPYGVNNPPPVSKRLPIFKKNNEWIIPDENQYTTKEIELNTEMKWMKERWNVKNLDNYLYHFGKTSINEDGLLCLKIKFSRDNPERYDIPIAEILDEIIDKKVLLELFEKSAIPDDSEKIEPDLKKFAQLPTSMLKLEGILRKNDNENLVIKTDEKSLLLKDILSPIIGNTAELEILSTIDENNPNIMDKDIKLNLQFRYDK